MITIPPCHKSMKASALVLPLLLGSFISNQAQAFDKVEAMVAMRDGTNLATDVYVPSGGGNYPIILIRTPYNKGSLDDAAAELICDTLGFALAMQDTRGRYASEGIDQVFTTDAWGAEQDGYDTIDWLVNQSFSNGHLGMMGVSAMGITANMAAGAYHPNLRTIHVGVAATDFYHQASYQGGSYREALMEDWINGQGSPWMLDVFEEHPYYDNFWAGLNLQTRTDEMTIPIFHYGGFHDIFAEGTVGGFVDMNARHEAGEAGEQRLLMGPWTHVDEGAFSLTQGELTYPSNSFLPLDEANPVSWFNQFLKGRARPQNMIKRDPVLYYVMGDPSMDNSQGNFWAEAKSWPPVGMKETRLYFGEGTLSDSIPSEIALDYVYDPANPSPTIGGRNLSLPAGPRDQGILLDRSDVLVFETEPLDSPMTILGMTKAILFIESDKPDTDFTVRLADVYPDGRAMLVTDGNLRTRARHGNTEEAEAFLTPGQITALEVEIGTTAQMFEVGHKIQVIVTSSNHRRFKVAHNTDNAFWDEGPGGPALNTIHTGGLNPSHLRVLVDENARSRQTTLWEPNANSINKAWVKTKAGKKLSAKELAALEYEGGRLLLEALYGSLDGLAPKL